MTKVNIVTDRKSSTKDKADVSISISKSKYLHVDYVQTVPKYHVAASKLSTFSV